MDLLDDMRLQQCVYWAPTGTDDYNHTTYAAPVQLRVRWSDRQELFTNKAGGQTVSKAKVYLGQDVHLDGVLWKGTLEELTDEDNPFANRSAWEIQAFKNIPTIDADDFLKVAML